MNEHEPAPDDAGGGQLAPYGMRGRFNAWFLDFTEGIMHRMYGAHKKRLFRDLSGTVVEIGPGAGANMRYYTPGLRVIAVEPNAAMHERLLRRAQERGIDLEIRVIGGEQMDVPDQSADLVIGTLLLCTVEHPSRVLSEIRRILRPGGRYVFVEHVAAESGGIVHLSQKILHRPHCWLFEGCHTDRRTWKMLSTAGFSKVEIRREKIWSPMFWIAPTIVGEAVR